MGGHAKLAPSAAYRWMACPGSVALCATVPDVGSAFAEEGTFAHGIAAQCLDYGSDAVDHLGTESEDGEFTVDQAMADHIQTYLDCVRGLHDLFCPDGQMRVEQKVRVNDAVYGTADVLLLDDADVHVIDLKFGAGVYVEVKDNPQLMIYGLGALNETRHEVRHVHLHVVQPRHHARQAWRTTTLTTAELRAWQDSHLTPAITAALPAGGPLVPGEKQCQFCAAKAVCPALRKAAMTRAQDVFATPTRTPPAPTGMTPAELGEALAAFPLVEEWMKAVRSHAYDQVSAGREIPGFKLVRKTGNRKWADESTAVMELARLGVDPHTEPKIISPAEAERRIGKSGKKEVAKLAYVPDVGTALVPDTDSRPAFSPTAAFPVTVEETDD